jgi:cold shock CspA family protein
MQATVSAYDPDSRSGRVLLDDGVEMPFPGSALDGSGLRLLRPGQRVRIAVEDGAVTALQVLTLS